MGITAGRIRNCTTCKHSVFSRGSERFICDSPRIECKTNYSEAMLDGLDYPRNCGGYEAKLSTLNGNERYPIMQDVAFEYMTAGKAEFILHSNKTNEDFKFKLNKPKESKTDDLIWFSSNFEGEFDGTIKYDTYLKTFKYKIGRDVANTESSNQRLKMICYVLVCLKQGIKVTNLEVYHTGRCGKCGKPLTHGKTALMFGFGGGCVRKAGSEYLQELYKDMLNKNRKTD